MATPSSASSPPPSIKVLTLNVWGLAYLSKARQFRIGHIADRLAKGDWDIVALQEIWVESDDWRLLRSKCSSRLPYSKFFLSGAFGSGLAILSRFPIKATHTHPYTLNGLPIHVGHGDWFVGKAAGSVTLDLGGGFLVDVYDTHTVAAGGENGPEKTRTHRIVQAWELAKLVQSSAERGRHVIALGDFNSTPPSLSMSILRHIGQLSDAFLATHPSLPPHSTCLPGHDTSSGLSPDPQRCIDELGVTCDSPLNTWTAGKKLDARALAGAGKRLDYAFYRGPCQPDSSYGSGGSGRLKPTECRVTFTELVPGSQLSYTDHFGLEAIFEILPQPVESTATQVLAGKSAGQTLTTAMTVLSSYLHVSSNTQRWHILGFSGCLTLALALAVVTPFVGYQGYSFWAAIAIVLATAAGWGGTTLLYSAVVWGEWEKRAIRTVIESMELERSQLVPQPATNARGSSSSWSADERDEREERGPLLI